jgi:hypothetical protein
VKSAWRRHGGRWPVQRRERRFLPDSTRPPHEILSKIVIYFSGESGSS